MRRLILAASLTAASLCVPARAEDLLDLQPRIAAAAPGSTLVVQAGTYRPIVLDKPLTLVGEPGAVIDGQGRNDVVLVAGAACTIRGFTIRNSGADLDRESTGLRALKATVVVEDCRFEDVLFGIDLKQSPHCVIRRNHLTSKPLDVARRGDVIRLFRSDDCLIEQNVIEDGRDALLWYSNRVTVRGNLSRRNRYGFHAMYANDVVLEDNRLEDNSVGVYLMYGKGFTLRRNRIDRNRGVSGYGVGLKEVDAYDVRDNLLTGNRVGLYVDGSPLRRRPGNATVMRNTFACNDVGMTMLPSVKGNRVSENNFIDNHEQVAVQGRGAIAGNAFDFEGRGNYWSDYAGFDADHDGVGDQPYAATKLFESLMDREPKLRLMLYSPAHDAIEFVGRAVPSFRPEPKFADAHPLMAPVGVALDGTSVVDRGSLARLGTALVGLVVAVALLAFRGTIGATLRSTRRPLAARPALRGALS